MVTLAEFKVVLRKYPSLIPMLTFLGGASLGGVVFMGYAMFQHYRPESIEYSKRLQTIRHCFVKKEERGDFGKGFKDLEAIRNELGISYKHK